METKTRYSFFAIVTIFVLLFSLTNPVVALADDETPPPAPTEEPAVLPEEQPAEEPAVNESTPEVEEGVTVTEIIEEMPQEIEVVLLNEQGEVEPLVTEEAAEILENGDPMWCPTGVLPGGLGCTSSFTSFNGAGGLLAFLLADPINYAGAGTIYIASNYNSNLEGGAVVISGTAGYGLTDLTFQGGWDFGLNTEVGTSLFRQNLSISDWSHDLTLNDLIFRNVSGNDGLTISTDYVTDADIELNNIIARNNGSDGVDITNNSDSGTVIINTGIFNANGDEGLYILSNGDIFLNNITANNNTDDGADLDNCNWNSGLSACLGAGNITISGTNNNFNDNDDDGLQAYSAGNITISGTNNNFNDNDDNGLQAYSAGNISLTEVDANRNSSHGAYLDNTYGNGDITLTDITANFNENGNGVFAYAAGDVSIEGGYFKGNERRGVYAQSDYGNIEVTLSDFINNGASGLRAEAYNMDGIHGNITLDEVFSEKNGIHGANLAAAGNIFITGGSEFINNDSSGVHIMGLLGDLSVSGSLFSENDRHGLDAEFIFGEVSIANSVFTWNHRNGLNLSDVGESIEITGSDFLNNRHDGAYLYNCGCTISDITIDSSGFSDNGWNGLVAYSHGLISLNDVTADGNDDAGAYLDNASGTGNVNIENSQFNNNDAQGLYIFSMGNIFIDPTEFNNNGGNGLEAYTSGNITLLDVTGNGNQGSGAFLLANRVTITCSSFENNFYYGANVIQTGSLRLNGVTFSGNGSGAYNFSGTLFSDPSCVPTPGSGGGSTSSTIIPITGGEPITCDAALTSTTVRLPKGDEVTLPCPINEFAVVNPTAENELSIPLGGDDQFISALTVHVIRDGKAIDALDKPMQVSFVMPEGKDPENLVILFWNGTEWLDLGGEVSANELYFEISTVQLGTFVLAER